MKKIISLLLLSFIFILASCTSEYAANYMGLEEGSDERRQFIDEYEKRERDQRRDNSYNQVDFTNTIK